MRIRIRLLSYARSSQTAKKLLRQSASGGYYGVDTVVSYFFIKQRLAFACVKICYNPLLQTEHRKQIPYAFKTPFIST